MLDSNRIESDKIRGIVSEGHYCLIMKQIIMGDIATLLQKTNLVKRKKKSTTETPIHYRVFYSSTKLGAVHQLNNTKCSMEAYSIA